MNNSYDNAFYNFRKRVCEGTRKNKLAHSATISPQELNAKFHEDIIKNKKIFCFVDDDEYEDYLEHMQSPLKGSKRDNAKYYQREELPNGKGYRYYYTKAEWDAAHNNKKGGNTYKDLYNQANKWNKKPASAPVNDNKNTPTKTNTSVKDFLGGVAEGAKKYNEDQQKEKNKVNKTLRNINRNISELIGKSFDKWEDKIHDHDESLKERIEEIDAAGGNYKHGSGVKWVDLEDTYEDIIRDIEKKYNEQIENEPDPSKKGEIARQAYDEIQKEVEAFVEEETAKREKSLDAYEDLSKSVKKINIIGDEIDKMSKFDKQIIAEEMGLEEWSDEALLKKYGLDEIWEEMDSNDDNTDDYKASLFIKAKEGLEEIWNDYKNAKKALNHGAVNDNELINEYFAFKKRVKAGNDTNSLYHSNIITPATLNRKYHEDYASECYLVHASGPSSATNKYYRKLDNFWGKGKHRYFYSKEEWDGYQKNLQDKKTEQTVINLKYYGDKNAKQAERERRRSTEKGILTKDEEDRLREDYETGKLTFRDLSRFEHKMEKGHGFIDPTGDDNDMITRAARKNGIQKPYIDRNNSLLIIGDNQPMGENQWMVPKKDQEWTKEDDDNLVEFQQPMIDHCLDFYETFALNKKKMTEKEAIEEINNYLDDVCFKQRNLLEYEGIDGKHYAKVLKNAVLKKIRHLNTLNEAKEETKKRKVLAQNYKNNKEASKHAGDRYK